MSVIFYHTSTQKKLAEESMMAEQKKRLKPIATKILPATEFTEAEKYVITPQF